MENFDEKNWKVLNEILTTFNAITSSIEHEEIEPLMGIVRYREYLEILKSQNAKIHADWEDILQKTGNLVFRRRRMEEICLQMSQHEEYSLPEPVPEPQVTVKEELSENKENAKPKTQEEKPNKVKPKKKTPSWEMPFIDLIDQERFNKLGRHEKGRLKFEQLTGAIEQVDSKLNLYLLKHTILRKYML